MTLQRDLNRQQLDLLCRSSVATQLGRYAVSLSYENLPEPVVRQAKRCLLDALGCAIGAFDAPGRPIVEQTVRELGGTPEATLFGSGIRTNVLGASLLNSFLVRFLDYNDVGGGGHNSDALASLLAVAEREHLGGRALLTALVISYELGGRLADAVATPPGEPKRSSLEDKGWTKDVRGGLNQPPAIGYLLGMDAEQIANAIGLCLSHALPLGILDGHREELTMGKNIRFGWVAHDAVLACLLARGGFTGPVRIVESDVGVRNVIAQGEMDLERLTDFSGWRILGVRFKSMPLNGTTQGHVQATLQIVLEHGLKAEDVAAVRLRIPLRENRHTTAMAKKYPANAETANHSAYYANAVAIVQGELGVGSMAPEAFTDPRVLDLIEKITITPDPGLAYYEGACSITTTDGCDFHAHVDMPHGYGSNKLTDREIEDKFRRLAEPHLSADRIDALARMCWEVEQLDDVGELARLVVEDKT